MVQVYQEVVILLAQSLSETLSCTYPGTNYIGRKCSQSYSLHPGYLLSADFFFKIDFFKKFFQEYHQSVKQFGPRSGLTEHQA